MKVRTTKLDALPDPLATSDSSAPKKDSTVGSGEDEKKPLKTMIRFPEEGLVISIYAIKTIDKEFRIRDSNYSDELSTLEYGIVINKGMDNLEGSLGEKSLWFLSEEIRDKRYKRLMDYLEEAGYAFIDV